MIGDCDPCTCPESQLPTAAITIHLPNNHHRMTDAEKEFYHYVTCTHCGRILRYSGVRRSNIPGFRWETVPWR